MGVIKDVGTFRRDPKGTEPGAWETRIDGSLARHVNDAEWTGYGGFRYVGTVWYEAADGPSIPAGWRGAVYGRGKQQTALHREVLVRSLGTAAEAQAAVDAELIHLGYTLAPVTVAKPLLPQVCGLPHPGGQCIKRLGHDGECKGFWENQYSDARFKKPDRPADLEQQVAIAHEDINPAAFQEAPMPDKNPTAPVPQSFVEFTGEVIVDTGMMALFQQVEARAYRRAKRRLLTKWPELKLLAERDEGLFDRVLQTVLPYSIRQACMYAPQQLFDMGVPHGAIDGLRIAAEYAIRGNMYKNMDIMADIVMPTIFEFIGLGEAVKSGDSKRVFTLLAEPLDDDVELAEFRAWKAQQKEKVRA